MDPARRSGGQLVAPHRRRHEELRCVTWGTRAVLTFLIALLVAGIAFFVTLLVLTLVLQPHSPYLSVEAATLNTFRFDQTSIKDVEEALVVEVHNGNTHSSATFSRLEWHVRFAGQTLAVLRTDGPIHLPARSNVTLRYLATAQDAPLDGFGLATVQTARRDGVVAFEVEGQARTRYKFKFVPINTRAHLSCQIRFVYSNGNSLPFTLHRQEKWLLPVTCSSDDLLRNLTLR